LFLSLFLVFVGPLFSICPIRKLVTNLWRELLLVFVWFCTRIWSLFKLFLFLFFLLLIKKRQKSIIFFVFKKIQCHSNFFLCSIWSHFLLKSLIWSNYFKTIQCGSLNFFFKKIFNVVITHLIHWALVGSLE